MTGYAMDRQGMNKEPWNRRLAGRFRVIALGILASGLLAACSGPLERQKPVTGIPGVGQAQRNGQSISRAPKAAVVTGDSDAGAPGCLPQPAGYRVRDLQTPWGQRRYLMPDGTLSAPPGPVAP